MSKRNTFSPAYILLIAITLWKLQILTPQLICTLFNWVACLLLGSIFAYYALPFVKKLNNRRLPTFKKAVLITGCDHGFGFLLAQRLDSIGFQVFASCLFPSGEGAQQLQQSCSSRLKILGLDVTKDESVKEAFTYVNNNLNGSELWAVVNNAGTISNGFAIEWSRIVDFQDALDVNTIGVIRMCKAFLPLLRRSKGRIITMTSRIVHFPSAAVTPYSISKAATSSFCVCLRQEMQNFGIKVITIEPEAYKTQMSDVGVVFQKMEESSKYFEKHTKQIYNETYFKELREARDIVYRLDVLSGKLYQVIDAIEDAICVISPDNVYKPCSSFLRKCAIEVAENLPQPLLDTMYHVVWHNYFRIPIPVKF